MNRLTDALDAHPYCDIDLEYPADFDVTDDEADLADQRRQAEIEARDE